MLEVDPCGHPLHTRTAARPQHIAELSPSVERSVTAVGEYVSRARVLGITWPIPPEIDDAELERRLFVPADARDGTARKLPDWARWHDELKRRGATLMVLWDEHRVECPDGHGYSRFCELYSEWRRRLSPVMRQTHAADKLFVDWAGVRNPSHDRQLSTRICGSSGNRVGDLTELV